MLSCFHVAVPTSNEKGPESRYMARNAKTGTRKLNIVWCLIRRTLVHRRRR